MDPKSGEVLAKKGDKYTKRVLRAIQSAGMDRVPIELDDLVGRIVADDIVDPETGEVLISENQPITGEARRNAPGTGDPGDPVYRSGRPRRQPRHQGHDAAGQDREA